MNERVRLSQEPPAELQPSKEITFRGLCKASVDVVRLYRSDQDKMARVGAMILVGMKAAFPEMFTNEQLQTNPNLKFFNCCAWLAVEINDAVDIIPQARANNRQEVIESIFDGWKKAMCAAKIEADLTPEKSAQKRQLLKDYQREILFCEKLARETPETEWDLDKLIRYREIMNAISLVNNAVALLGNKALSPRLETIDKQSLSQQSLETKYSWMIDGTPDGETERRMCALFNLVMGVQVIDDWFDIEDDRKLGLYTIATQVLKDEQGRDQVKSRIQDLADGYFNKAEAYGVTKAAGIGTKQFFTVFKNLMRKFPTKGGRRERLLNGGELIISESEV